jgi:hypothetical protein
VMAVAFGLSWLLRDVPLRQTPAPPSASALTRHGRRRPWVTSQPPERRATSRVWRRLLQLVLERMARRRPDRRRPAEEGLRASFDARARESDGFSAVERPSDASAVTPAPPAHSPHRIRLLRVARGR